MGRDQGTRTPPTSMGWYVVWRQGPQGELPPTLYFCVEANTGDVQCMSARPSEDEEFLSVCHESFQGALWLGPFKTRKEALEILESTHR
jgi:hypothetical protein